MSSKLEARVKALERNVDQRTGCRRCRGLGYTVIDDDGPWPDWLNGVNCRGCGEGIKVYYRSVWDAVPS